VCDRVALAVLVLIAPVSARNGLIVRASVRIVLAFALIVQELDQIVPAFALIDPVGLTNLAYVRIGQTGPLLVRSVRQSVQTGPLLVRSARRPVQTVRQRGRIARRLVQTVRQHGPTVRRRGRIAQRRGPAQAGVPPMFSASKGPVRSSARVRSKARVRDSSSGRVHSRVEDSGHGLPRDRGTNARVRIIPVVDWSAFRR
jgi:hypothetical protein